MSAKIIITTQHDGTAWQFANDLLAWLGKYGSKGLNVYVETRDGQGYRLHDQCTSEQRWEMMQQVKEEAASATV